MLSDQERLRKIELRLEVLEERFADVLAALSEKWTTLSKAAQLEAGRVASAAAGKRSSASGEGKSRGVRSS